MGSVASKWNKTLVLLRNKELSQNVPSTKWYSKSTLKAMLERYKMVYVKPNTGTGGSGVMRVEKSGGHYKYQLKTTARTFKSFDSLASFIDKKKKNRSYIIQRGVNLLQYNGRSFDLRVMVQKNPKGKWETTGVIGRLGHPKKIITNVCKGGSSKPVELLLGKNVNNLSQCKQRLRSLGTRTARQLNSAYKNLKEIGLDVGVDRYLKEWVIEVNTRPAIYGFKSLKDKSIYQKILRYQKIYQRR
ncbi:hypothetical protein BRE01_68430 [Brevibacillus reuszeri]|uniref:ATP-grasp domain-containing protein n=1 Tax=Brevibacillus reuszeri TaxID=54915 RepID=A0A0K9YZS3_9BACL|nr:YheC/YheD family protein [Brevibacillus reuszeri]KNB74199.1 hypothetical protein ADS79_03255 [Brevibacillus reuszeri]MED1861224.1 YheC/YheD family protein [Brevibacillus reuszeri]GED73141.1 hypothetical protein BRE01_68430 [Brevibacillus reuszeri]